MNAPAPEVVLGVAAAMLLFVAAIGIYSAAWLLLGAWLQHRKQQRQSPVPPILETLWQASSSTPATDTHDEPRPPRGWRKKPEGHRAKV